MALCLAYGWLFVFAHCCSAIPAKERGKASLFLCCAKATLLLAPKGGEPRSPPLESPIATWRAGIAGVLRNITLSMGTTLRICWSYAIRLVILFFHLILFLSSKNDTVQSFTLTAHRYF